MSASFIILLLYIFLNMGLANAGDSGNAAEGEQIFKDKCSVCHKTTEQKLVGPGLVNVMDRRSVEWVDKWLQSPEKVLQSKDKTAVELKKHYFRLMPTLDEMQDPVKRKHVIEYLKTLRGG